MSFLYLDESIRERAGFVVLAAVCSDHELSKEVRDLWIDLGEDPTSFEYKSSSPKDGNPRSVTHRDALIGLLFNARVGLAICPANDRSSLGKHGVALCSQLVRHAFPDSGESVAYFDQNIRISEADKIRLMQEQRLRIHSQQDSLAVPAIQLADVAAHMLGSMLLEELGLLNKSSCAGEGSGYDPKTQIELGFELWASLRYSLVCTPPDCWDPNDQLSAAMYVTEGSGLYIAPSCSAELGQAARRRFGTNYLGCIH